MTPDPREESVRRAYESARFDERTPDEAGFAERFEGELKPNLVSGIGFNLRVNDERKRRRKIGTIIAAAVAILFLPVVLLLNAPNRKMTEVLLYALVFAWILIWAWAFKKRPTDEDPNHADVIEAVLERFECRIGVGSSAYYPVRTNAPIFPEFNEMHLMDEHVVGRFDGRVAFVAVRAKAALKEGKRMRTTFRGWHLVIDLPFSFSGTTVIREKDDEYGIRETMGLQEVALESGEFGRRFIVESTDQVEARMILTPDVMQHLLAEATRLDAAEMDALDGGLMLGFQGARAFIWMPSWDTALAVWKPLDPPALIEGLHGAFEELASMRAFLRDIDVIAESEGFRAQAARNARSVEAS